MSVLFLFENIVTPDMFNDDIHVVALLKVVTPDTFNDDIHVVLHVAFVNIAPLNTAGNLKDPSVDVQSNLPVGFIETIGLVVFWVNLALSPINNKRLLTLLAPNNQATPSVAVWNGIKYSWPDNKILGSYCVVPLIIV